MDPMTIVGPENFESVVMPSYTSLPCNPTDSESSKRQRTDESPMVTTGKIKPKVPITGLSFVSLKKFTKNFHQDNFLGNTTFGKLYRGKVVLGTEKYENVIVKRCENHFWLLRCREIEYYLKNEEHFLMSPRIKNHPDFVKVVGYCLEDRNVGVVYEFDPVDTLSNLIVKDSFSWSQRIEIARKFAELLEYLHLESDPYVVCNLNAEHIIIDQDFKPRLIDFSWIEGGITVDRDQEDLLANPGYDGPEIYEKGDKRDIKSDVYAYGVILVSLIAKRVYKRVPRVMFQGIVKRDPFVHEWAAKELAQGRTSLVHESLRQEVHDESVEKEITSLAMSCLKYKQADRPTMAEVVYGLKELFG